MIDYLIVVSGLAGISFSEIALNNNKTILVLDNNSQNSSRIAGGLYNPIILKRFSEVWQAEPQLVIMNQFYADLRQKIAIDFDFKKPILRKFYSVEEQNNWFSASDKVTLAPFLSTNLIYKKYQGIDSPFGYGEVLQTGYVDTASLVEKYREYLLANHSFLEETFDYCALKFDSDGVLYKDIKAKQIIFAEGFGIHSNPYFNNLPLDGTKGELFTIKAPTLDLDVIINTSVFILPIGNDLYKVGATYNWKDINEITSQDGIQYLKFELEKLISIDFEIIGHFAGIRPAIQDRRPVIGFHPKFKNIGIFNGLGTKGAMLSPYYADMLANHIAENKTIDFEVSIERFTELFQNSDQ